MANSTRPGVMQVVRSTLADDPFVGSSMKDWYPMRWNLGRQYVRRVGAEVTYLNRPDWEAMCQLVAKVPKGKLLSFDSFSVSDQVRDKFADKVILLQTYSDTYNWHIDCPQAGSTMIPLEYLCKQFSKSTILYNWPESLAQEFGPLDPGNFLQEYTDCEILNHNSLEHWNYFREMRSHLAELPSVRLHVNLETIEHPLKQFFANPFTRLCFQWLPGLLCIVFVQLALRALLIRIKKGWRGRKWYSSLALVMNACVLSVLAAWCLIEGGGTAASGDPTMFHWLRNLFPFFHIGSNLLLAIAWKDISKQMNRIKENQAAPEGKRDESSILTCGFLTLCLAELVFACIILIPGVSEKNVKEIAYLITTCVIVLFQLCIGIFFARSAGVVLKHLKQMQHLTFEQKMRTRRFSRLVLASGFNSITITVISVLQLYFSFACLLTPHQIFRAAKLHCRLLDAFIVIWVFRPSSAKIIPVLEFTLSTSAKDVKIHVKSIWERFKPRKKVYTSEALTSGNFFTPPPVVAAGGNWQTTVD